MVGRSIVLAILSALVVWSCGTRDSSLGETAAPLNGAECDAPGESSGECQCFDDGRWLCAGQNSVTCRSVYGSGGGRLLVSADMPCEMQWSSCSDDRVYGVECDGLSCTCMVNEQPLKTFITPRCAEMAEANRECGFSLQFPEGAGAGSGPMQGMPCSSPDPLDDVTDCVCVEGAWDCPTVLGCRLAGVWGPLEIDADGTWTYQDPDAGLVLGTWELDGAMFYVRSQPGCEESFGTYQVGFESACSALLLQGVAEPCVSRGALLDGFRGAMP